MTEKNVAEDVGFEGIIRRKKPKKILKKEKALSKSNYRRKTEKDANQYSFKN